jgi:hypothetical protein
MQIQVYELADIAAILDLPKHRVKNWTIGRPFSVRPSVRLSSGRGSRNLFGRNDVYCFGLVQTLSEGGAPVASIQDLLKRQPDLSEDTFWKEQNWVMISRRGDALSYEVNFAPEFSGLITLEPGQKSVNYHVANIKSIVEDVSGRIAARFRKQAQSAKASDARMGSRANLRTGSGKASKTRVNEP